MIGALAEFKRSGRTMTISKASHDHLREVFRENFSASDIAEPLVSFDETTPAADVRAMMEERRFEVVGVRRQGLVVGYVRRDELGEGKCGDSLRPFDEAEVVSAAACFPTIVAKLRDRPRLFRSRDRTGYNLLPARTFRPGVQPIRQPPRLLSGS